MSEEWTKLEKRVAIGLIGLALTPIFTVAAAAGVAAGAAIVGATAIETIAGGVMAGAGAIAGFEAATALGFAVMELI